MIGNNTLYSLYLTEFTQLFEDELKYKESEILTDIFDFLSKLNVNTTKYIEGSLESFKINIESYFLSGVIVEGIAKNIDNIAQTIFNNPEDYLYYGDPIASRISI